MSSITHQAAQVATKRNNPSPLFGPNNSKRSGHGMTSDTIATDIAAFKKNGGRIEVLGNTPLRVHTPAVTSRAKTTTR
jgi:hypothetical protein